MKPTPTETNCPSAGDLYRLLRSQLPDPEAARLEGHLRDCAACRQVWYSLQGESDAGHTPPLLHPIGDTRPGVPEQAPPASAISWSSEIALEGGGGERAPGPPRSPSASKRSFPFLAPPQDAGELGWLGHYRITGVLGEGGMGFVFDAFDTHLHRRVGLKVLKPDLAANVSFRERFLQEARAAAQLPDEYIITIYQVGLENDVPFLAMKFLHGETLEQRLQRDGRLPAQEVLRIGREIALGLSAAHDRGLIHRDIKPANLWLETPASEQGASSSTRLSCEYLYRVKILDFGLARPIHDTRRLTATGLIVGTPQYLAPEQARGQPLDHRCDLFSLGIVLYRLVTGILPFDGADTLAQLTALAVADPRPIEELAPDVPAGLRNLIHQMLARDPAKRPPTARAVAELLRTLEKGEPLPSDFASLPEPTPTVRKINSGSRFASRRRWLAAGGVLALLLFGGILLWRGQRPAEADRSALAPPVGQGPIKIGVLFSTSGTMAVAGSPCVDAAVLAIEEINQQGGLLGRSIEAVIEDGASTPERFAEMAEKLITQDGVCSLIGCRTSASRKSTLPVIETHKNLLLYPMQFEGLEQSPNIIYLGATPNQQLLPALEYFVGIQRKRRLFLMGSDYVFPRAANAILRDELRKYPEVQIVGEQYVPRDCSDLSEPIKAIVDSKPDLIINTLNGDSNSSFFRALRRAGIRPDSTPVLSSSIEENDLRSLRDEGIGHFAAWSYFQSIDRPENEQFVRKFRARFSPQRVLSDPMETTYFGIHLWAQAVQAAGSIEPAAIRQAIQGRSFDAPEGKVRIDPGTCYTWRAICLGRIVKGGQFDILWSSVKPREPLPFPLADAHRSPAAWETFLQDLHKGWGGQWEVPRR